MSSKNTWLWIAVAVALCSFIFVYERYFRRPETGPKFLLPGFNPKEVTTIQIRPAGQPEIRAERTNENWQLVEPVIYPAKNTNVNALLEALHQLMVAHEIPEQELRSDPKADETYGIEPPQLSLIFQQGNSPGHPVHFGNRTPPGDQVFVQVVGIGGVFVVDADVLRFFPQSANNWRETSLASLKGVAFDHITVTNAGKNQENLVLQFQRNATNKLWSMTLPMPTRADPGKVADAITKLENLRIEKFLPDDPKADLDSFGLQPPELTLALAQGTNTLLTLDFGRSLTNSPGLVYARRRDQKAIVAVSTNALEPWRASHETFRDRHLVNATGPVDSIEIRAQDNFSLQWQTNGSWRVMPQDFPADAGLAAGTARTLTELQAADFEKDSVTEADLPHYGLGPPARKYILTWASTDTASNPPVELDFGTNSEGKVFARRAGEDAVYGIAPRDFEQLPAMSWEMHDRRVWTFEANDVTRIIIRQNGQTRQIDRNGTNRWALAPGSQGVINVSAIEDTVRELGNLTAFTWVGHGSQNVAPFGFKPDGYQLSIELKNGEKLSVQFGGATRFGSPYASVVLNNEPWIFEFPPDLYPSVEYCLTIPAAP